MCGLMSARFTNVCLAHAKMIVGIKKSCLPSDKRRLNVSGSVRQSNMGVPGKIHGSMKKPKWTTKRVSEKKFLCLI